MVKYLMKSCMNKREVARRSLSIESFTVSKNGEIGEMSQKRENQIRFLSRFFSLSLHFLEKKKLYDSQSISLSRVFNELRSVLHKLPKELLTLTNLKET